MQNRKPILTIEMFVKKNTTNQTADKPTKYVTNLKTIESSLTIGNKEADAKLTITAQDDLAHYNFPVDEEYVIEVYPKRRSEPLSQVHTQQRPLADDSGQVDEAFAEAPCEMPLEAPVEA